MNSKQAKNISIIKYLESEGILPKKISQGKAYFLSPLRTEKEPSFKVDINKNVWFDYGIGKGGKVIDLCMLIHSINVSEALKILSDLNLDSNINFFSFHKQKTINKDIQIKHTQEIRNKALVQYLEFRKIPLNIAKNYLTEIYYTINSKKYFALGFENNKGGFELRNKYFKGSSSPKYYTTIKGGSLTSLNVFEGFIDFLTALHFYKTIKPGNDTIILNSLSFIEKILPILKNYKKINLFLDNDKAGHKIVDLINENHTKVTNQSALIYPKFKDFNEFLKQETAT